jgi:hypothetical protein
MVRVVIALISGLALSWGAPPRATVQDTLYKADGSRFNGFLQIEWQSFEASDTSQIATHYLTSQVVAGVLRVKLVPNAAGSSYKVRYVSDGKIQFQETWFVPASSAALRLRDVRVATIGPITPPPAVITVAESDVTGLVADLAARPMKGPGYAPSRAAYIDETGALQSVVGSLEDCVRVDGTAGACGSGPGFVDGETPEGAIDGVNAVFTLANVPSPASSLALYRNGLLQRAGTDYTHDANTVSFTSQAIPQAGDTLLAVYRLAQANSSGGGSGVQVLCSGTGAGTSSTTLTQLGSCTVPGGLLRAGDRVEIRYDYSHEGATAGVAFQARWGSTTLATRNADAGETAIAGRAVVGVYSGGAQWSGESWGGTLAFVAGAGPAADSLTAALTIGLLGRMTATTSETITLRNYTVLRYPARANP